MQDLLFIVLTILFFALAGGFVLLAGHLADAAEGSP